MEKASFQFSQSLIGTSNTQCPSQPSPALSILPESYWNTRILMTLLVHGAFNSPRVLLEQKTEGCKNFVFECFQFSQSLIGTESYTSQEGKPSKTFNSPRVLLEPFFSSIQPLQLKYLSILPESYWNRRSTFPRFSLCQCFQFSQSLIGTNTKEI